MHLTSGFVGSVGLLLDVTGATHRFESEKAMLDHIRAALVKQGFAVRGAMAGSALE